MALLATKIMTSIQYNIQFINNSKVYNTTKAILLHFALTKSKIMDQIKPHI